MKKPCGSRYLIVRQLTNVFRMSVERIQTVSEADRLEFEILRARAGNILTDDVALELLKNINVIRREKGWIDDLCDPGNDLP